MSRVFWTVLAIVLANLPAAYACPGCKEPSSVAGASGVNGISLGFSLSVVFMLGMIGTLLGGMLYMIVKTCRQLDGLPAQPSRQLGSQPAA
jgi:hypothetical protein